MKTPQPLSAWEGIGTFSGSCLGISPRPEPPFAARDRFSEYSTAKSRLQMEFVKYYHVSARNGPQ